jgi:hypothetical protein
MSQLKDHVIEERDDCSIDEDACDYNWSEQKPIGSLSVLHNEYNTWYFVGFLREEPLRLSFTELISFCRALQHKERY